MLLYHWCAARGALVCSTLIFACLLFAGCRRDATNPFLADDSNYGYPQNADDPLAESLARLRSSGEELKTSADGVADTAQEFKEDAAAIASDTVSETRQAVATSLDAAESHGRQLASDAVVAASATAGAAGQAAQLEAVHSLEDLPLEQAGPLLLVAMSQGSPSAQRAAAEQLARRWPPATGYPADSAAASRAAALAELQRRWAEQYGQIDEAVAAARLEAAQAIDSATGAVDQARGAMQTANQQLREVQQLANAYRQAELPAAARQELAKSLEQLATSADTAVRVRAAQAMGESGDPAFVPALVMMLDDQPQVQAATLDSLERVTGQDMAEGNASNQQRVAAWQAWYTQQQAAAQR